MVNLKNLITEKNTVMPFPGCWEGRLEWMLEQNGIKDYRILTRRDPEYKNFKNIPESMPRYYGREDLPDEEYPYTVLLVSKLDAERLHECMPDIIWDEDLESAYEEMARKSVERTQGTFTKNIPENTPLYYKDKDWDIYLESEKIREKEERHEMKKEERRKTINSFNEEMILKAKMLLYEKENPYFRSSIDDWFGGNNLYDIEEDDILEDTEFQDTIKDDILEDIEFQDTIEDDILENMGPQDVIEDDELWEGMVDYEFESDDEPESFQRQRKMIKLLEFRIRHTQETLDMTLFETFPQWQADVIPKGKAGSIVSLLMYYGLWEIRDFCLCLPQEVELYMEDCKKTGTLPQIPKVGENEALLLNRLKKGALSEIIASADASGIISDIRNLTHIQNYITWKEYGSEYSFDFYEKADMEAIYLRVIHYYMGEIYAWYEKEPEVPALVLIAPMRDIPIGYDIRVLETLRADVRSDLKAYGMFQRPDGTVERPLYNAAIVLSRRKAGDYSDDFPVRAPIRIRDLRAEMGMHML